MKGINAMTGVLIMLLIVMTIFTWISTERNVGAGQAAELERTALVFEADRRLQKAELYIQSMFGMSSQAGSYKAARNAGRAGQSLKNRYWMCKGSTQVPGKEEASYAISNHSEKIASDRLSEIRGVRANWVYDVSNFTCVETGYNEPVGSSENDYFYSSARMESIKTQDRSREVFREEQDFEFREQVNYNRYWYMYSGLKNWTEEEAVNIPESIKTELEKVNSGSSLSEPTCVTNESGRTAHEVCSGPPESYGPSGTYPDPYVCRDVVQEAETAVQKGVSNKVDELESEYLDDSVTCSASFNENSLGSYPGIKVSLKPSTGPTEPLSKCAQGYDDVSGNIHNCVTSWTHKFDVTADFQVSCTDTKFSNVPEDGSLTSLTWQTNMSLRATGPGNSNLATCSQEGGSIPPFDFISCNAKEYKNQCSNSVEVQEELK